MLMSVAELIEMIDLEKDMEKLFRWYQKGHSRNLPAIMTAALRQAIRLKAGEFDPEDDFENSVFHALAGYGVALGIKNEGRTVGTQARNSLKLLKPVDAIKFLVNSKDKKFGLVTLTSMHLAEFTVESVVVTYPERFLPEQVLEAQRRLDAIFEKCPKDFIYPEIEHNIF
jgi:hypothetical protein